MDQPPGGLTPVGFVDADNDGKNDRFQDLNGDGTNDVDGKPYPHGFRFEDLDGDGNNDLWTDADGNGVNDLVQGPAAADGGWVDMDGDGMPDGDRGGPRGKSLKKAVLDVDRDGKNDITGEPIPKKGFKGSRYGWTKGRGPGTDTFIDRDGDGMADDRGFGILHRKGGAKKKGKR
jgi:hypothetical protein